MLIFVVGFVLVSAAWCLLCLALVVTCVYCCWFLCLEFVSTCLFCFGCFDCVLLAVLVDDLRLWWFLVC